MEIVISAITVAKLVIFLCISLLLAFITLFPIGDQPTSRGQVAFWLFLEVTLFVTMFNIVTFKIVA